MGINDIVEGAVRIYDTGKEYLSPQNLTLAGSIALSTLIGCTDSTTQIDALKQENAALRRELEETRAGIPPPKAAYSLPENCEKAITYETLKSGEASFIKDIKDGEIKAVFAVMYQDHPNGWEFNATHLMGGKVEQLKGQDHLGDARDDKIFIRFRADGRNYALFIGPQPDGSMKVASAPESCVDKIDLKRVYGK